jgi:cysteine desulfurase family protein (TIGR01976 family)
LHAASLERIRARFPALARREAGRHVGYFDGPGGTQVPESVARAVADYLLHRNANTHWGYPTSEETDRMIADSRAVFAEFLHCEPAEVSFGANMTTLTYHLARAVGRGLAEGDEIVVTRLDHQANVAPWRTLESERGVVVREVPFDPDTGLLDTVAFEEALGARTRVVALGAASNALGTITDLGPLLRMAKEAGAFTFVDGVHYAPHVLPDVETLACDAFACSPYKFYGPHLGVLFVRREVQEGLDVPRLVCAPADPPERIETGTLSHEGIAGSAEAVEFLAGLAHPGKDDDPGRRSRLAAAYAELHERASALFGRLWEGLAAIDRVTLYGPPPGASRTPTVGFRVRGLHAGAVARRLAGGWGVFLSHGDFYASTVVDDLRPGPGGLVRAGLACYTTAEEVDRLLEGIADLPKR